MWQVAIELCKLLQERTGEGQPELTVDDDAVAYGGVRIAPCSNRSEFEVWAPGGRFEYVQTAKQAAMLAYSWTR